jgi:hypothetical protein
MLDEAFVDVGLTLPHRLKTNGREGKRVLRALAQRWLPEPVVRHPKHGFHIPPEILATAAISNACGDLLLGSDARVGRFLNRALISDWVNRVRGKNGRPTGGDVSHGGLFQRVFTLLSLELWLRDFGLNW